MTQIASRVASSHCEQGCLPCPEGAGWLHACPCQCASLVLLPLLFSHALSAHLNKIVLKCIMEGLVDDFRQDLHDRHQILLVSAQIHQL